MAKSATQLLRHTLNLLGFEWEFYEQSGYFQGCSQQKSERDQGQIETMRSPRFHSPTATDFENKNGHQSSYVIKGWGLAAPQVTGP